MARYATSKWRVLLLTIMLAAGVSAVLWPTRSYAQDAGATAAPAAGGTTARPPAGSRAAGLFSIIMDNRDFVFYTILLCSVIGVTLIIQGFIRARRSVLMPQATTDQIREMIQQRHFQELLDFTRDDPSFISRALYPALNRAPSFSSMKEAMETAIAEQTAEQFRRIEYLNIIGNLGPLLGLLGTVLGMIEAFQALHAAEGQANPADLAYGISKALTHTMLGLCLAVPCLAAFGVLRTMVDRLTVQGALVAEDLLLMIKPNEQRSAAAATRPGAVPQPAVRKAPVPTPIVSAEA